MTQSETNCHTLTIVYFDCIENQMMTRRGLLRGL